VGLLGNVYSRRFGGTAFTAMVTGVLFLVPVRAFLALYSRRVIQCAAVQSGLPQAGGFTASGSGIDIGGAMIAVTVGLFMS
jgi:uncharacterized membrane protein YjjB (DUF3815 family)